MATRPFDSARPTPVLTPAPAADARPFTRRHVLRPADLVSFTAAWQGLTLERPIVLVPKGGKDIGGFATEGMKGQAVPRLIADAGGGTLTIGFAFQHTAEIATETDKPAPDQSPPVAARAANPSRLVYKVPAGTVIDYSVEGLLKAMATLELAVVPLAVPALAQLKAFPRQTFTEVGSLTHMLLETAMSFGLSSVISSVIAAGIVEAQRALAAARRIIVSSGLGDFLGFGNIPPITVITPGPIVAVNLVPRQPRAGETAIEAPFRLILSPSNKGAWAHALKPVTSLKGARTELWHSRLAVRGAHGADEIDTDQRIVRAIWTRDRDGPATAGNPFNSLPRADQRDRFVMQTADPTVSTVPPEPVRVRRLALSSLGAWLDLHVQFPDPQVYLGQFGPLASWDQVSPMGRDQFVRVVTPGYLYPLGHAAYLVEIMFRKVVGTNQPQAALFTRTFVVLGDPDRTFARRDLPFIKAHVGPLRTPDLEKPGNLIPPLPDPNKPGAFLPPRLFWPTPVGASAPLQWKIDASDQDGATIHLNAPLLFVQAGAGVTQADIDNAITPTLSRLTVPANGQTIAFAPAMPPEAETPGVKGARASAEGQTLSWAGAATFFGSEPYMTGAEIRIPAIQRLTGSAGLERVAYPAIYKSDGFGSANKGNVFLKLDTKTVLEFGSSEHSGGFINPSVAVGGLARSIGLVPDADNAVLNQFKASDLFGGVFANLPKLFGLFSLADLLPLDDLALALAPKFVTEQLDKVAALLHDLDALKAFVASEDLMPYKAQIPAQVDAVTKAVSDMLAAKDAPAATVLKTVSDNLAAIAKQVTELADKVFDPPLAPFPRAQLDKLTGVLGAVLGTGSDIAKLVDVIAGVEKFVQGLNPGGGEFRTHLEWHPKLTLPSIFPADLVKFNEPLNLIVEARASAGHAVGIDVSAELNKIELNLIAPESLMRLTIDRLAFRASAGRRPEIDVVFGGIQFVGLLGFIDVLRRVIPLDGFSDPPFLDVSTEGVTAGFTLSIPNVAIGVFSLTNISLGADARVPFLGESISVGFNFCTRERPFTLAVFPLGGGGFVGMRLSPKGMVLLEMSLEFGAVVALDFGVASGSISAMGGVYIRLEGSGGSLTGFFRIRGEVDVLSLISASIELYMALTYQFDTGKMIGEASITIAVHVLFFSTSVSVHTSRTFAGSNGDPTARDMLLPDKMTGVSAVWNDYCAAFAAGAEA